MAGSKYKKRKRLPSEKGKALQVEANAASSAAGKRDAKKGANEDDMKGANLDHSSYQSLGAADAEEKQSILVFVGQLGKKKPKKFNKLGVSDSKIVDEAAFSLKANVVPFIHGKCCHGAGHGIAYAF
jgi:hypothetical protein